MENGIVKTLIGQFIKNGESWYYRDNYTETLTVTPASVVALWQPAQVQPALDIGQVFVWLAQIKTQGGNIWYLGKNTFAVTFAWQKIIFGDNFSGRLPDKLWDNVLSKTARKVSITKALGTFITCPVNFAYLLQHCKMYFGALGNDTSDNDIIAAFDNLAFCYNINSGMVSACAVNAVIENVVANGLPIDTLASLQGVLNDMGIRDNPTYFAKDI